MPHQDRSHDAVNVAEIQAPLARVAPTKSRTPTPSPRRRTARVKLIALPVKWVSQMNSRIPAYWPKKVGVPNPPSRLAHEPYSCIYCRMKTTIDVPEDVLVKAKVFAAARRTTLRELVIQGLKQVIDAPLADEEKQRKVAIQRLLKAMQAGNTEPMVPLTREEIYDR